jgi:3-oxoacyl-[acyl-carrier protein] reductase
MRTLVTGVSRGIGASVADNLAREGRALLGVYRNSHDQAKALQARVAAASGSTIELLSADLATATGIAAVVDQCSAGAQLEGLVFNAGIAIRSDFVCDSVNGHDPLVSQLRADLEAPLLLCRSLLKADCVADGASLVFVSSNLARHGLSGKVAYSAAKAGLEAAVRGLARELGPRGIRVNAVAPGLLVSAMTADMGDAGYAAYAQEVPLRRIGVPVDIAGPVAFLLGDASSYVSGQVLDIDGGWGA